jgi:hypothetical protein
MRTDHRIHLSVLFMPSTDEIGWVVQALQHDFAAQGRTQELALKALAQTIAGQVVLAQRRGIDDPLSRVPPAPPEYWDAFERAALRSGSAQPAELDAPGLPPSFVIQAIADRECIVSR